MDANYSIICPEQSDSPLSTAASIIGIITFVSTTFGGLTIFYTIYKSLQTTQQDMIECARAAASYSEGLIGDIEAMGSAFEQEGTSHSAPESVIILMTDIRRLSSRVKLQVKQITAEEGWLRRSVATYRIGQDHQLQHSIKELERLNQQLESRKMNIVLRQLNEHQKLILALSGELKPGRKSK